MRARYADVRVWGKTNGVGFEVDILTRAIVHEMECYIDNTGIIDKAWDLRQSWEQGHGREAP